MTAKTRNLGDTKERVDDFTPAPAAPAPTSCNWHQQDLDGDSWDTGCGHTFVIIDGTPTDNDFRHCCFCGKPLAQHPYVEDDNNDE